MEQHIREYCLLKGYNAQQINDVLEMHFLLATAVRPSETTLTKWVIKNLKFSNMFCYGANNEIDFTQYSGVVGIMGENKYGKSSIIDVILYTLYGRCSKTEHDRQVLNVNKNYFSSELLISANEVDYRLTRRGKLSKSKTKLSILTFDLEKQNEEGIFEKIDTKLRDSLFGCYEIAVLSYTSLQRLLDDFLHMTPVQKFDALAKLYGLDYLEEHVKMCKNMEKDLKKQIDEQLVLKKSTGIDVSQVEKQLAELEINKNLLKEKISIKDDQLLFLNEKLRSLLLACKVYGQDVLVADLEDENALNDHKNTLINKIKSLEYNLSTDFIYESYIKVKELEVENYSKFANFNETETLANLVKLNNDNSKAPGNKGQIIINCKKIDIMLNAIIRSQKGINNLVSAQKELVELKNQKAIFDQNVNVMQKQLAEYGLELARVTKEIKLGKTLTKNNVNQIQIKQIEMEICSLNTEIKTLNKDLDKLDSLEEQLKQKIRLWNECAQKIAEFEGAANKMNNYLTIMAKKGLAAHILKKVYFSQIEEKANAFLNHFFDLKVELKTEEIVAAGYHSPPLNVKFDSSILGVKNCAGSEAVITGLAFRIAFMQTAEINMPLTPIIDEGFLHLDEYTSKKVPQILDYLKENFKYIMLVSHEPNIKSLYEARITISRYKQLDKPFSLVNNVNNNVTLESIDDKSNPNEIDISVDGSELGSMSISIGKEDDSDKQKKERVKIYKKGTLKINTSYENIPEKKSIEPLPHNISSSEKQAVPVIDELNLTITEEDMKLIKITCKKRK